MQESNINSQVVCKISILPNIKMILCASYTTTGLPFPLVYIWNLFQNFQIQNNSQKLYTENMPKALLYQAVF